MITRHKKKEKKGFGLAEIIISVSIIVLVIVSIISILRSSLELSRKGIDKTQAALLIEEGSEAIMLLRDMSWDSNIETLSLDTEYYLYWDGDSYVLSSTPVYVHEKYLRKVIFREVLRDGNDNISESGQLDPDTRKVEIDIVFSNEQEVLEAEMLIHKIYGN